MASEEYTRRCKLGRWYRFQLALPLSVALAPFAFYWFMESLEFSFISCFSGGDLLLLAGLLALSVHLDLSNELEINQRVRHLIEKEPNKIVLTISGLKDNALVLGIFCLVFFGGCKFMKILLENPGMSGFPEDALRKIALLSISASFMALCGIFFIVRVSAQHLIALNKDLIE